MIHESIFVPFPFPQFTPFQVLDVRHVEKIKSMAVIKRLEKSNYLMKIKATLLLPFLLSLFNENKISILRDVVLACGFWIRLF